LGSHLLYHLLKNGEKVVALHRPSSSFKGTREVFALYSEEADPLFDRIEWRECDLFNPYSISEALSGAVKVVHAAAQVSFDPSDRKMMVKNNQEITSNMVSASLGMGIKRFVHISSTAAIGRPPAGEQASENMIWTGGKGSSGYAESKFRSEMEVWRGIKEGLPAVILNPSIILGTGFRGTGSGALLERIDKGMRFYTEGVTAYVGVEDVVKAILIALNSDEALLSKRYIIAAENLSYHQLFTMMAEALGRKAPSVRATRLMTGIAWRADKLASLLPWRKHILTRETADSSHSSIYFSNQRAREELGIEFMEIRDVVAAIAATYSK